MMDQDKRMEILRMAQTIVTTQYTDKRAQDHNKWLAESEYMWKNKGIRIPYPSFPAMPSEADILERAQEMIKFVEGPEPAKYVEEKVEEVKETPEVKVVETPEVKVVEVSKPETTVAVVTEEPKKADTKHEPEIPRRSIESLYAEYRDLSSADHAKSKVDRKLEEETTFAGKFMPSLLQTIGDMKSKWVSH